VSLGPSQAEEYELLRAYHERGDLGARERLVEANLPLARAIARRYAGRGEQFDDLVQVASIGLIKAVDRFDMHRGVFFRTYAVPTMVGEIKRHFRDRAWAVHVPRRLKELNQTLSSLVRELSAQLERSPTIAELAAATGVDEEAVVEALEASRAYTAESLAAPAEEGSELDRMQTLGAVEPGFEQAEDQQLLESGLEALDSRERRIIQLRFYDGLTQTQIANELGISQMHVSRLIRRALETMRGELQQELEQGGVDAEEH
jgi:RNA polymerase sigma-B factor